MPLVYSIIFTENPFHNPINPYGRIALNNFAEGRE